MEQFITFIKPTENIQRAFGLFNLLKKKSYKIMELDPTQKYLVIDTKIKHVSSSDEELSTPIQIPANYDTIKF